MDLTMATVTLRTRLLTKIVMPGPATPCAIWVGSYNSVGRTSIKKHCKHHRRPVARLGGRQTSMIYVAPTLLQLAGITPATSDQTHACHRCPTGSAWHGVYTCVDLAHLRWGTPEENEADKREGGR